MANEKIKMVKKKRFVRNELIFAIIFMIFVINLITLISAAGFKPVNISTYILHNESDSQFSSYLQMKNSSSDIGIITSEAAQLVNDAITCYNAKWLAPSWSSQTLVNGTWKFSIYTNSGANFAINRYFLFAKIIKVNSTGEFNPVNTSLVGFAVSGGTAPAPRNWSYNVSYNPDLNLSTGEKIGAQICVVVTGGGASNKYGYMSIENNAPSYVVFPSQSLETTPPNFSLYVENPLNNSAYFDGGIYRFNVSIEASSAISQVGIEFNGVNYTNGNIGNISNVYMFNRTNLAAGTHSYRWWANDSYGNFNSSELKYYTISKADNTLTLTSSVGWSAINYGTEAEFSCSAMYGTPKLYINNVEVVNPKTIVLGAGTHNIKCNISESANYSAGISSGTLTVNKASPVLTFLANSGTANLSLMYPLQVNITAIANFGTVGLDKDSVNYLSSNGLNVSLSAGSYLFRANITGNANYSDVSYSYYNVTINKADSHVSIVFDKASPQSYGTIVTPICSIITGAGTAILRMNGNVISSGVALNLGAGNYSFNCSLAVSQNYSYSENISSFTINQASTTTALLTTPSSPINYGTASNFSCSNSAGLSTALYINSIDRSSEKGLDIARSAGSYIVNCTYLGNQNYSGSSEQASYVINKANGDVRLYLNGIEDNLVVDYPQQYNITAMTLYGNVSIYKDGIDISATNGLNITPTMNSGYYNITAISSGDENHSSLSITQWLNVTVDFIAPVLDIISPQEGGSYGYNTSLVLSYSAADEHLDSCWYNINNGNNVSLGDCQNTTFNISNDGTYILNLYANDSLGNIAVKNATFSVLVGSPTIVLDSPIGIYLNNPNVIFRYTPSDLDLGSCELWGDFNGSFSLNQTNNYPANGVENIFNLSLADGTYKWNVRCNDSMGNHAFNGNKTFYVDTTLPLISIFEPTGTKTSWSGIPLTFTINDSSPVSCKYSVSWSTGGIVISNISIANCSSIVFNLSSIGDYTVNLFVNDMAGNFNSASSSFTISSVVTPPSGGGGGSGSSGGGGFGGGAVSPSSKTLTGKLEISKIENIIAHAGDKKTLSISAKNTGKMFLNNCRLTAGGDVNEWFSSKQSQGISPGENVNFIFELNVPEDTQSGYFSLGLELGCDELVESSNLGITIPAETNKIKIKEVKQEGNSLKVVYEYSGTGEVKVELWVMDEFGAEIKRIEDKFSANNNPLERSVSIEFGKKLVGIYSVYAADSIDRTNSVKQSIILGKTAGTGFTVLDQPGNKMIAYAVFLLFVGGGIFFIVWKSRKNRELEVKGKRRGLSKRDDEDDED